MTPRGRGPAKVKRQPIMGYCKQVEHHVYRDQQLCSSPRYLALLAEAKEEFKELERRQKLTSKTRLKTRSVPFKH